MKSNFHFIDLFRLAILGQHKTVMTGNACICCHCGIFGLTTWKLRGPFLKKLWCCVAEKYYNCVDNVNWPP